MSSIAFMRRHRSAFVILLVALLLVLWIASGVMTRAPPNPELRPEPATPTVAVRDSQAEPVERLLTLQGEVLPDHLVTVRAETDGRVVELPVELGKAVESGTVIARIGMDDRAARLRRAEAAVKGRETDFRGAEQLAREGYQAQLRVDTALAELEAARADLETVRLDIQRTRVEAPIAGVLDRRHVDIGDYVSVGNELAEILENNPLNAIVQVPQHAVHRVHPGGTARVTFAGSDVREGVVRHVSARADSATRTFRVEIEVPNPDRSLPSGSSVEVRIPVEEVRAHWISPALVTLDADGRLGIKTLDEEDRVEFRTIDPIRADSNGIWVSGLPETVRIITIGQGFVNVGERVLVVSEDSGPDA
ncbi:MAG TPA: efflux RND transporter periplasmic adaptor subunit [Thioalkalivibrio sp.]|nr:efflux RND transporter periplasmic adaptor subunit [Thioalkalivibrio sp.]